MFDAEFTHVGDACTFEVLLERMGLTDPALKAIAEVAHDIRPSASRGHRDVAGGRGAAREG